MMHILNEKREPVPASLEEYAAWDRGIGDFERSHRVGLDSFGDYHVSTVFLGLEHPGGMFFETMVRQGDVYRGDSQKRYRTWSEAEAGHAETVALLRAAVMRGGCL